MDHLSTPGQAPAAFASHPLASVAPLASGADAGHETSTKASYQDALLFIAPPLLSAAVLGALSMNLHRIPSAHPLQMLRCSARGLRQSSLLHGGSSALSARSSTRVPCEFRAATLTALCCRFRRFSVRVLCAASF